MAETFVAEKRDYSLIGQESIKAVQNGLAEATWYQSPVPREKMKELLVRKDGPAIRDTLLWFALIIGSGVAFYMLWGTWWAILPYIVYSALYAGSSDSRWHESSHGTAFKTDWMNSALYEIASFMVFRQSITWRWSHTRHHSDTIIRGRDPEIAVPRPPDVPGMILQLFGIKSTPVEFKKIVKHAFGKIDPEVATYVPEEDYGKVFFRAKIYLFIYAAVIGASIYFQTLLPLFYIGFPTLFGSWLMVLYGTTQHAGLQENVLDHRLNCRTIYMNRVHRYLYWNMNYHLEHHMFPLVPYHNLAKLHEIIKDDCPPPYTSIQEAYKEIIPTVLKQVKDPYHYADRILPEGAGQLGDDIGKSNVAYFVGEEKKVDKGWIKVCASEDIGLGDVVRFDLGVDTFAVYRTEDNKLYATDGICTHGSTHLAEGLVIGDLVECPKHNGRFSVVDGSVQRPPVCAALRTYQLREENNEILLDVTSAGGVGQEEAQEFTTFKVVSNDNVATFIKELVLEPVNGESFDYQPGDYIQLEIPAYGGSFKNFQINEPFLQTWKDQNIFQYHATNLSTTRRNYSLATNSALDKQLRFNVRIALPPIGLNCSAGVGSSYVYGLRPGDEVKVMGPFGDFRIKETGKEMVYIGGGAGMAPLRSHISHLFDTQKTERKVSFWYGARSLKEVFYDDYFQKLTTDHDNFSFTLALSEPLEADNWEGHTGFIHEVTLKQYLSKHEDPTQVEYYLCGPPVMVKACITMLEGLGVSSDNIAFDEF